VDDATIPALPAVRLKIQRRSSHPWIFQKMVERPAERIPPGSVVDVLDRDGQWVGRGFYNGHSRIAPVASELLSHCAAST
jgi:23S rRNA (cytosine1962-C5)-methyltransferase